MFVLDSTYDACGGATSQPFFQPASSCALVKAICVNSLPILTTYMGVRSPNSLNQRDPTTSHFIGLEGSSSKVCHELLALAMLRTIISKHLVILEKNLRILGLHLSEPFFQLRVGDESADIGRSRIVVVVVVLTKHVLNGTS